MRNLEQALLDHELIVLRVIGEWLGLDLTGTDKATAVDQLTMALAQVDLVNEMEYLEPEEAAALTDLVRQGGRAPVAVFARQHGEVRPMGPGRMEREEPWLDPANPAESLWYRGFLYRAFDQTDEGMLEFYYIPQELLYRLAPPAPVRREEPAFEPDEPALGPTNAPVESRPTPTDAVDDLTTLLALAQRTGLRPDRLPDLDGLLANPDRDRRSMLLTLATEMSLLRRADDILRPTRAAIDWLQQSREAQLRALVDAWSRSAWNELRHTPGLTIEGEGWQNDPLPARTALMDTLPADDHWYRLADVVAVIHTQDPDFQRPDGNYETWYIRDAETQNYLSGFADWGRVEGRLLRYLIQGPLFWLGMVELSAAGSDEATYRLSTRALAWLGDEPAAADEIKVPLIVQPDGIILAPFNASRYERFQAARIADPEPLTPGKPYRYRIVPSSLTEAQSQGISPERMLQFLESAGGRPVPAAVRRGISRWAEKGVEGRLQSVVVLRVGDAEILDTLRANPKTRDFIAEALGDLAVVIRRGEWEAFRQAVAQLGLLLDVEEL